MRNIDQFLLRATEPFLRSLRRRLLVILLIAVVPILSVIFYQAKLARDVEIAEIQENAWEIAENVAIREARFIDSARQLLNLLADTADIETAACDKFLKRFTGHNDLYVDIGVARVDGIVRCAADQAKVGTSVSRSTEFQRALTAKTFAIGDLDLRGASGRRSVGFALPMLGAAGVNSIVYAALDVAWITQLAAESHLPGDVALSVVDSKGMLLARFPDNEKWVGKHIPDAPMFEMLRLRSQATPHLVGLDGVDRIYALKQLAPNPNVGQLYVMVGIPKTMAYGPVNRALARNLSCVVRFLGSRQHRMAGGKQVRRRVCQTTGASGRAEGTTRRHCRFVRRGDYRHDAGRRCHVLERWCGSNLRLFRRRNHRQFDIPSDPDGAPRGSVRADGGGEARPGYQSLRKQAQAQGRANLRRVGISVAHSRRAPKGCRRGHDHAGHHPAAQG